MKLDILEDFLYMWLKFDIIVKCFKEKLLCQKKKDFFLWEISLPNT